MPADSGFLPPVQFSPLWLVLGAVILILIVAWFVLVPFLTRERRTDALPLASWAELTQDRREFYVDLIDEVEVAHARGQLGAREAHQRLSALVRGYASEASGFPTSAMTLTELRRLGLPGLTSAVERFYPVEFGTAASATDSVVTAGRPGPMARAEVADAIDLARRVVREWH
jgi:hypothetical protein